MEKEDNKLVNTGLEALRQGTENGKFFGVPVKSVVSTMQSLYGLVEPDSDQEKRLTEFHDTYVDNYKKYLELKGKINSNYLQDKLENDEKSKELWLAYKKAERKRKEEGQKHNNVFFSVLLFVLLPLIPWMVEKSYLKSGQYSMLALHILMLMVPLAVCTLIVCICDRGSEGGIESLLFGILPGAVPVLPVYLLLDFVFYRHVRFYVPDIRAGFMLYGAEKLLFAIVVGAVIVLFFVKMVFAVLVFFAGGVVLGLISMLLPETLPDVAVMQKVCVPWMTGFLIVILATAGVTLVLTIMNMDTKAEYKRHELLIQKAYEAFCGRQKELIKEEIDYYSPHVAEQYLDPWIERMQQSDFHRVTMDPDFEGDDEEF